MSELRLSKVQLKDLLIEAYHAGWHGPKECDESIASEMCNAAEKKYSKSTITSSKDKNISWPSIYSNSI